MPVLRSFSRNGQALSIEIPWRAGNAGLHVKRDLWRHDSEDFAAGPRERLIRGTPSRSVDEVERPLWAETLIPFARLEAPALGQTVRRAP